MYKVKIMGDVVFQLNDKEKDNNGKHIKNRYNGP